MRGRRAGPVRAGDGVQTQLATKTGPCARDSARARAPRRPRPRPPFITRPAPRPLPPYKPDTPRPSPRTNPRTGHASSLPIPHAGDARLTRGGATRARARPGTRACRRCAARGCPTPPTRRPPTTAPTARALRAATRRARWRRARGGACGRRPWSRCNLAGSWARGGAAGRCAPHAPPRVRRRRGAGKSMAPRAARGVVRERACFPKVNLLSQLGGRGGGGDRRFTFGTGRPRASSRNARSACARPAPPPARRVSRAAGAAPAAAPA